METVVRNLCGGPSPLIVSAFSDRVILCSQVETRPWRRYCRQSCSPRRGSDAPSAPTLPTSRQERPPTALQKGTS